MLDCPWPGPSNRPKLMNRVGIRREDKNRWESRVPLIPEDVARLRESEAIDLRVQSSQRRAFADPEFTSRRVPVQKDVDDCSVVLGVKEIPVDALRPHTAYVFFSHVIKGQAYNMPMLRRLMELGCTLIDYERLTDDRGQRLVAFGFHAGLAGAIDTLWALGQRWAHRGRITPLADVFPAHRYASLAEAKSALSRVAAACRRDPQIEAVAPVILGVTGYGRVAQGVHDVFDVLEPVEVLPEELGSVHCSPGRFVRVRFEERHFAESLDSEPFDRERYYREPDAFRGVFGSRYLPHLTALVNAIYWEPEYPRLVLEKDLRALHAVESEPRLEVIGDVSCDIGGSIEVTTKATDPANPVYTWDVGRRTSSDGFDGDGPTIMAVDILPTELPREASESFSRALSPWIPALARHDFRQGLEGLPVEIQRATILDRGRLTADYAYLDARVANASNA